VLNKQVIKAEGSTRHHLLAAQLTDGPNLAGLTNDILSFYDSAKACTFSRNHILNVDLFWG
jgi:hypothetical protein